MTIFDVLNLIGGVSLFLFGMNIMGMALERCAGNKLQSILEKLTTNKLAGLLTGAGITAIIQSSNATTVMVVGFVNSGLMTLKQATSVVMGANIGTTVTAWILSLSGIKGSSIWIQLLKPTSFTPFLALVGIVLYMFFKDDRKKEIGTVLLGFAVLMFGMETMTDAVSGLAEVPAFQQLFIAFKNPILGVLVGAFMTAIIQSSSASVGILQAFAMTGAISYGAAFPIIMGQNIGTCVTSIIASFGTNRNAKRTVLINVVFKVMGTVMILGIITLIDVICQPAIMSTPATITGIALFHTLFNVVTTAILLPLSSLLEKLACRLIPDAPLPEEVPELDELLLKTPATALTRCRDITLEMAECSVNSLKKAMDCLLEYKPELAEEIREAEGKTDHYEDIIGTYLVKLSALQINNRDGAESAMLLKVINDLERISDHAVNLVASAEEMRSKGITFSHDAQRELVTLTDAAKEILDLSYTALVENDEQTAAKVEPLEQVIDQLKEIMRDNHTVRLQQRACSIESGFIWVDILTNLERTSDHCSNIAGCVIDTKEFNLNIHESLRSMKLDSPYFKEQYAAFADKYLVRAEAKAD